MKEAYIVIQCGYEGIDKLCFLTDDEKEAVEKIKTLRLNCDEWTKPDQFCIQKWDGEVFKCVCIELKVEPSQMWYM